MSEKNSGVLIIGIDGGTWKILNPLIKDGKMPNLEAFIREGASGSLKSTVPPVTAPAWTTFQTGVNPGKHGIYDFQNFNPKTHKSEIVNSSQLALPTVWDLINSAGGRVSTVNVPMTYPPSKRENRVTVGGMLSPKGGDYIYPRTLAGKLKKDLGYRINGGPLERRTSMDLEDFIQEELEVERSRCQSAKHIMDNFASDVFMLHLPSTDGIQHCYYPFLDPNSEEFSQNRYETISNLYRGIDEEIGELLALNEDKTTFLISDHGFRQVKKYINLNAWLRREEYLKVSGPNLVGRAVELARRLDVLGIGKKLIGLFLDDFLSLRNFASDVNTSSIDWNSTDAYMANGTVFGSVCYRNGVPEAVIEELKEKIADLTDPETGESVISSLLPREETFTGDRTDQLPNLFVQPDENYTFGVPMVMERGVFRKAKFPEDYLGTHDMDGILAVKGPCVKKDYQMDQASSLQDIAPTILALMGIEVPGYMDGKVLETLFTRKLNYEVNDRPISRHNSREQGKNEDKAEVKDRLKDLGYL